MAVKPFADIAPLLGRGIVYDGTKTYTIHLQEMNTPKDAASVNLTLWMKGSRKQTVDAGPFPYALAYTEMTRLAKQYRGT